MTETTPQYKATPRFKDRNSRKASVFRSAGCSREPADPNEAIIVEKVCCGNESAKQFLHNISRISQIWDDVIDRDRELSDYDIYELGERLLVDLPKNEFYVQNFAVLQPHIEKAILDWRICNRIEDGNHTGLLKVSYIKRSVVTDIALVVNQILGGGNSERAVQTGVQLLEWVFGTDNEQDYFDEHEPSHPTFTMQWPTATNMRRELDDLAQQPLNDAHDVPNMRRELDDLAQQPLNDAHDAPDPPEVGDHGMPERT